MKKNKIAPLSDRGEDQKSLMEEYNRDLRWQSDNLMRESESVGVMEEVEELEEIKHDFESPKLLDRARLDEKIKI